MTIPPNLWLQSHAAYSKLMHYDPMQGSMAEFSREDLDDTLETVGFYGDISGVFAAFYCWNNGLFITIDQQQIRVDETLSAEISTDKKLIISKGTETLVTLDYQLDDGEQFVHDPTAFIDDEDSDFGLLLTRIIQSPKRQKVLLNKE